MQVKSAAPAAFGANCTFALAATAVAAAVGKTQQQQQSELKLELGWALQGPVGLSPCCHGNNQLLMENCMDVSNQPTLCLLSVRMSVAVWVCVCVRARVCAFMHCPIQISTGAWSWDLLIAHCCRKSACRPRILLLLLLRCCCCYGCYGYCCCCCVVAVAATPCCT